MLQGLYKNTVPQITPDSLQRLLQNGKNTPLLLDTRQPEEYKVSHLRHARFVNYTTFNLSQLADVPKNTPIVVYCTVGYRSEQVGEQLRQAGYTQVQNLYGGIFSWVNSGNQVYDSQGATKRVHAYSKGWGIWLQKGEKVYGTGK